VQRHRLTENEVACWARWRDGLTHVGNPVAVLAATLQQQRLPPGEPRPALRAALPAATPAAAPVTTPAPHAELWTTVCGRLEHQLGTDAYATWIADTSLLAVDDDRVVIGAPNVFVRDHLATLFATPLADAVQAQLGRSVAVEIVIDGGAP
jgi:hypothetical protein